LGYCDSEVGTGIAASKGMLIKVGLRDTISWRLGCEIEAQIRSYSLSGLYWHLRDVL